MAERQNLGRQKIELAKIQNPTHLQVSFSKRRTGIFKKASELSILCGVDIALIIFSPGRKVFTFGHPSMETVVENFLGHDNQPPQQVGVAQQIEQMIEASQYDRVSALMMQLRGLEAMREDQKKKGENFDRIVKENVEAQGWVRSPYDELNMQQLATLKNGMEILLKDFHQKAQQLLMEQGHGDGGDGGDGSTAASAFPMVFPPGGGGGGAADSGFSDNAYMPSGAMVFPPGGGGGLGGDTAASGFQANAYMPSGGMIFPPSGGGAATASGFHVDAYLPGGFNDASTGGASGSGANLGNDPEFF